jgi:hypothetical protein
MTPSVSDVTTEATGGKPHGAMRTVAAWGAVALCAALPALATAASAGEDRAALRLQDRSPITVAGSGFERGERVRVTLIHETSTQQVVRAGRPGTFVVSFAGTFVRRCELVRVTAVGGRGSRAVLKILPAPACMPVRAP